ncbi:antitoxin Xre/MbcA/ParS toxin-binding domain-containing protein [Tardiphaga sp.]|uniref:antitoxin Xre/MbcA/ParS toxin-binding domain-containing protein n=1 Tax=Tardiphaga sp. TaxID=1926292 RepID=UPI00352BBB41
MNPRTRIEQYQSLMDLRRQGPLPAEAQAALKEERLSVLEIRALADRVFGDEVKAEAWLRHPNRSMSGQTPFDLMQDELGAAVVRETLEQIDHGIFS